MDLFVRFLYDFLSLFFEGLKKIFLGLFTGIMDIFNLKRFFFLFDCRMITESLKISRYKPTRME